MLSTQLDDMSVFDTSLSYFLIIFKDIEENVNFLYMLYKRKV